MQCNTGWWSCKLRHALSRVKGCHYKKQQPTRTPERWPSFDVVFRSSPQRCEHSARATSMTMQYVGQDFKYKCQRMQSTSIRTNAAWSFGLYRACGRTCTLEKGHGPLHRPTFPRGIKSSCGRPGACQSKAIWIKAKCWIQLVVNSQGSIEKSFKVALSS